MNEKYLIGAAIGFAAAYVLLNRAQTVNPPVKQPPVRPSTTPTLPTNRNRGDVLVSGHTWDKRRPLIGWRPWGYTTYPLHV